jgi:hypothetical protein
MRVEYEDRDVRVFLNDDDMHAIDFKGIVILKGFEGIPFGIAIYRSGRVDRSFIDDIFDKDNSDRRCFIDIDCYEVPMEKMCTTGLVRYFDLIIDKAPDTAVPLWTFSRYTITVVTDDCYVYEEEMIL